MARTGPPKVGLGELDRAEPFGCLTSFLPDVAAMLLVHGPVAKGILCCTSSAECRLLLFFGLSFPTTGNREQMRQMHSAFEQTKFRPIIDKVFDFDQLKEAYDYAQSGDHLGKIVVKVASS